MMNDNKLCCLCMNKKDLTNHVLIQRYGCVAFHFLSFHYLLWPSQIDDVDCIRWDESFVSKSVGKCRRQPILCLLWTISEYHNNRSSQDLEPQISHLETFYLCHFPLV